MARTRLLKPDFFIDPDLGDLEIKVRYLFAGLWCHADKEGRLPYEPKKLKIQILPYDEIDIEFALEVLSKKPFVSIYDISGKKYIQITNWKKHQSPHNTEKESLIPAFNGELTVKEPLSNVESCTTPFNIRYQEQVKVKDGGVGEGFEAVWAIYPVKVGREKAEAIYKETVKNEQDCIDIKKAIVNYAASDRVQKGFVKDGGKWFPEWRDWIEYKDFVSDREEKRRLYKRLGLRGDDEEY